MKLFCIHKWSKWSNPIDTYNSGKKQQWRVCEHCNKATFRTLRWDEQTTLTAIIDAIRSITKHGGAA